MINNYSQVNFGYITEVDNTGGFITIENKRYRFTDKQIKGKKYIGALVSVGGIREPATGNYDIAFNIKIIKEI